MPSPEPRGVSIQAVLVLRRDDHARPKEVSAFGHKYESTWCSGSVMYHTGKLSVVMAFGEVLLMLMVLSAGRRFVVIAFGVLSMLTILSVGGVQGEASHPKVLMVSRSSQ